MLSTNSRDLVKIDKRDNEYFKKKVFFKVIKKDRDDNLIVKIKCNGINSIILNLTTTIQNNLNIKVSFNKIHYKIIIKDATIVYNCKFFSLEIWEILTLDYDDNYQKNNEEILKVYILNNLNTDILRMRFIDYIKNDYLLSNIEYNRKYNFCDNFINKYLFVNKFNGVQKSNAEKLIQQGLLEYLEEKPKRKIKKQKYEFQSSQKFLQLLNEDTREKTNEIYNNDTPISWGRDCILDENNDKNGDFEEEESAENSLFK